MSAIRDPLADHLLTPQNAALLPIDYPPSQIAPVQPTGPDGELQRDWARPTAEDVVHLVRTGRPPQE